MATGGKRRGAGRKPKAFTVLKRKIDAEAVEDAEYAFSLHVSVMRSEEHDMMLRLDCAREVMNRVLGKAKQVNELTGKDGGAISIQAVDDYREAIKPLAPEGDG